MDVKANKFTSVFFAALFSLSFYQITAQVGIGTTSPDPSAVLDIQSTTQGFLAPRMTTAERLAISAPAEGLTVFDTDLGAYIFYDGTDWTKLVNNNVERDNYKLIKSTDLLSTVLADELAAGGGAAYVLDENTLYEINGQVDFDFPIDLNNAYIIGDDTNEDIITASGGFALFEGANGGSLRDMTIYANLGSSVFNLNLGTSQRLVMRGLVMAGLGSGTVGTIASTAGSGALIFMSVIQFALFTNGITFNNIDTILIDNVGWLANNAGVMETFTGTFDIIAQTGGFFVVDSGETGVDVSSNPTITNNASLQTITFSGAGDLVNAYTTGTYTGYNFTNDWDVNCPGIPVESDQTAQGDLNLTAPVGSGFTTTFSGTGTASRIKLNGTTTTNTLFRFTASGNNRLVYAGSDTRYFNVVSSLSFQSSANNTIYILYIAKGNSGDATATVVEETRVYRSSGAVGDIGAVSVIGTIELAPGDFIEVWAERYSGSGSVLTVSLNLTIN